MLAVRSLLHEENARPADAGSAAGADNSEGAAPSREGAGVPDEALPGAEEGARPVGPPDESAGQASTSGADDDSTAALQEPWVAKVSAWARAAGLDEQGFFVAKPVLAGLGGRLGEHVVMAQGLPDAGVAAWRLLQAVGPPDR